MSRFDLASASRLPIVLVLSLAAPLPALAAGLAIVPSEGQRFAYLSTGPGSVLGVGSTGIDLSGNDTDEADPAAFSLGFTATGRTTLSFAFNLLTSEITGEVPDFFLVTLTRLGEAGSSERILSGAVGVPNDELPIIPAADFDSVDDGWILDGPDRSRFFDGQTGWRGFSLGVETGDYLLGFAVYDEDDANKDTALLVDNIRLGGVLLQGFEAFAPGTPLGEVPGLSGVVGSAIVAGPDGFAVVVPLPAAAWCLAGALGVLGAGVRRRPLA